MSDTPVFPRVTAGPTRTCVGCGKRVPAEDMLRFRVSDAERAGAVAGSELDASGRGQGRSVYVHAACVGKTPARKRSRSIGVDLTTDAVTALRERSRVVHEGARRAGGLSVRAARLARLVDAVGVVMDSRGGKSCKLPEVR